MLKNFLFKQIFVLFGVISLVSCKKEDLFSHLNTNGTLFLKTNLKYALKDPQQAAMASLGEPLPGWNSLTFILKKN